MVPSGNWTIKYDPPMEPLSIWNRFSSAILCSRGFCLGTFGYSSGLIMAPKTCNAKKRKKRWSQQLRDGETVKKNDVANKTHGTIKYETRQNPIGSLPSEIFQKYVGQRCEGESTETGAADCYSCGQRSFGFEVVTDADNGRKVNEPEPNAWKNNNNNNEINKGKGVNGLTLAKIIST